MKNPSETDLCFDDEVMLAGYSESHTSGPKVTFWLFDPHQLDIFRGFTIRKGNVAGQRFRLTLVEIPDGELEPEGGAVSVTDSREPNELARSMMAGGYFNNPKLWQALHVTGVYTKKQHEAWLKGHDCLLIDARVRKLLNYNVEHQWAADACEGDIVAHHCTGAELPVDADSRNPQKPPWWYAVPLCWIAHHQNWAHGSHKDSIKRDQMAVLRNIAVQLTGQQAKFHCKRLLGIDSLADITEDQKALLDSMVEEVE